MKNRILILGGYGNFGKRIAEALVKDDIPVIISGRNEKKATTLADRLGTLAKISVFDVNKELAQKLDELKPKAVINTCGPFQTADYNVARTCADKGVHYIDLADGREFVTGITSLDAKAKKNGVAIISGASTVPGLSSAVLERYKQEFSKIDSFVFGISPGQKAERGLATTKGVMTYVGRPLKSLPGHKKTTYGWQDIYRQEYPDLGKRWMANCEVPDLDLLPKKYGIKTIKFSAGMELTFMHLGIWLLSWLVRAGIPLNLPKLSPFLLKVSNWFNFVGTADGGMHIVITGKSKNGTQHQRKWFIIAKGGDGPHIPTIPAIILAKKIAKETPPEVGAYPCVGTVSLQEYINELEHFNIKVYEPL